MGKMNPSSLLAEQMVEAIGAYGLIVAATDLDDIRDERELPYPKETMVGIFLAALATVDDATVKESLRQGYFQLAQFLPGVDVGRFPSPARAEELTRLVLDEKERLSAIYAHALGEDA